MFAFFNTLDTIHYRSSLMPATNAELHTYFKLEICFLPFLLQTRLVEVLVICRSNSDANTTIPRRASVMRQANFFNANNSSSPSPGLNKLTLVRTCADPCVCVHLHMCTLASVFLRTWIRACVQVWPCNWQIIFTLVLYYKCILFFYSRCLCIELFISIIFRSALCCSNDLDSLCLN